MPHLAGEEYYGPGGGYAGITSANGIPVNTWTMVTSVYNVQTQTVKMYIDGLFSSQSQVAIASPDAGNNATVYIGSDNIALNTSYYLQGSIDDIRIYSRGLSTNQIHQLFTSIN